MAQQLDNEQYNDEELVEIKLALNLPYMSNAGYSRVDGEIEFDGQHYNYVKRKVENDTLYLLCLPNTHKTKLYQQQNKYTEQVADIPSSGKESNAGVKKIQPLSEYNQSGVYFTINAPSPASEKTIITPGTNLANPYTGNFFRPPESQA